MLALCVSVASTMISCTEEQVSPSNLESAEDAEALKRRTVKPQ